MDRYDNNNNNIRLILQNTQHPTQDNQNDGRNEAIDIGAGGDRCKNRKLRHIVSHNDHCSHIRTPESDDCTGKDSPITDLSKVMIAHYSIIIIQLIDSILFILQCDKVDTMDYFLLLLKLTA